MASILWTYIPNESQQALVSTFLGIEEKGHKVFVIDYALNAKTAHWTTLIQRRSPLPLGYTCVYPELQQKWSPRIEAGYSLKKQRSALIEYLELENVAISLLEKFCPDIALIWNPLAPNFGVLGDIALKRNIKCLYTERGILPGTIQIDRSGILNLSDDKTIRDINDDQINEYRNLGSSLLQRFNVDKIIRHKQAKFDLKVLWYTKARNYRQVITFLGLPPNEVGSVGPDEYKNAGIFPISSDYLSFFQEITSITSDTLWIFKPHPHSGYIPLPNMPNLIVTNADPHHLIRKSDIVMAHGSKLELFTLLMHKPLLLAGYGLFWGKGLTIDCESIGDILKYLNHPSANVQQSPLHIKNDLHIYLGWMAKHHLFFSGQIIATKDAYNISSEELSRLFYYFDLEDSTIKSGDYHFN